MANFQLGYNKTMIFEGGYSHHPSDSGGATYRGISRAYHPTWPGWAKIDELKKTSVMGAKTIFAELEPLVMQFYKVEFWDAIQGDMISDQTIANTLFDCSVLCGGPLAIRLWQDTLDRTLVDTDIDGRFGPQTLEHTNRILHSEYYTPAIDLFRFAWAKHLLELAHKRPKDAVFVHGWMNRSILG